MHNTVAKFVHNLGSFSRLCQLCNSVVHRQQNDRTASVSFPFTNNYDHSQGKNMTRLCRAKNNLNMLIHIVITLTHLYTERFRPSIYVDNIFWNFAHNFTGKIQQSI